jgi:N6-L-threonylcarbamoyladenine synthase
MIESADNFDFSFSGLKTSVVYYLKSEEGKKAKIEDIAAGFQEAAVDVLVKKTINAAKKYNVKDILLAGGVARNSRLRQKMAEKADRKGIKVHLPSPILCTDNAAMIATAGYFLYQRGIIADLNLDALPNLPLPSVAKA